MGGTGRIEPYLRRWPNVRNGYKQTSSRPKSTSALPPKADILMAITDFRLWLQGDLQSPEIDFRFAP